jgi:hypothetical protein
VNVCNRVVIALRGSADGGRGSSAKRSRVVRMDFLSSSWIGGSLYKILGSIIRIYLNEQSNRPFGNQCGQNTAEPVNEVPGP